MKEISKLLLIFSIFFNAGCGWIALADPSYSPKEYGCAQKLNAETKAEELKLDNELQGLSKDEVILKLGKPKPGNIKTGLSYLVNRDCFGKSCETRSADEAWYYDFVKKLPSCGRYAYSIIIYFVNGKVVRVG